MRIALRRPKADPELLSLFEESGRNGHRAAELLRALVAEHPERPELAEQVLECEHEGDRITHDILHRVAERGDSASLGAADAHALASALDDVVDHAEQAADQLVLYRIEAPMVQAEQLADVLVGAAGQVADALVGLRTGADLGSHLVEVHRLENEGDRLVRDAIASLFVTGIDPMVVIRWKDVFDSLEEAIDACERVAHVLEGIALKRRR